MGDEMVEGMDGTEMTHFALQHCKYEDARIVYRALVRGDIGG